MLCARANCVRAKRTSALTRSPQSNAIRKAEGPASGDPAADPLSNVIRTSLEDAKAEDIVVIDLVGKTSIADCMIVATGRSSTHVGAIADRVMRACREAGYPTPKVEGLPLFDWVLLDARVAIVHIFRPDVRQFYNLEKIWGADRPGETKAG